MQDSQAKLRYEAPVITPLEEHELLSIFQMTASEISAAACWWTACATASCP